MRGVKAKQGAISKDWRQGVDIVIVGLLIGIFILLMVVVREVTETVDKLKIVVDLLR
ncbi:hypothetical protein KAR91_77165 [Candidatus Pacearchaeota archaeon]|nr:hypothetical protein [Candidatus Pacearchaeota archaeon]